MLIWLGKHAGVVLEHIFIYQVLFVSQFILIHTSALTKSLGAYIQYCNKALPLNTGNALEQVRFCLLTLLLLLIACVIYILF